MSTLYQPASTYGLNSTEGYVRALIRSDNGTDHARLLEVTVTEEGVTYHVVAEKPGYELDEFRHQRRPVDGGDPVEHQWLQ